MMHIILGLFFVALGIWGIFDAWYYVLDCVKGGGSLVLLLSGLVADQAALHGLLKKVRDLGMTLVSVNQVQFNETHPYRSKKEHKMNANR